MQVNARLYDVVKIIFPNILQNTGRAEEGYVYSWVSDLHNQKKWVKSVIRADIYDSNVTQSYHAMKMIMIERGYSIVKHWNVSIHVMHTIWKLTFNQNIEGVNWLLTIKWYGRSKSSEMMWT